VKHKPLSIQAAGILQFGADEVQEAFAVDDDLDPVVFKGLIAFFHFVIEGQFIHESAAASSFDTNANEAVFGAAFLTHEAANLVSGIFVNGDHAILG